MSKLFQRTCSILFLLSCATVHSMVLDNRYFPLIPYPYVSVEDRDSHAAIRAFASTASVGFGRRLDGEVGIPEILNIRVTDQQVNPFFYNQRDIARALRTLGKPDHLDPVFVESGHDFPWRIGGKLQSQGMAFSYHQQILHWFSLGFNAMFMHVESTHDFIFTGDNFSAIEKEDLERSRRLMHKELGLSGDHVDNTGMGDIDFYVRFGKKWEYEYKFRKIDAGLRLGVLIPAGRDRQVCEPASVPFGGEGHWGIYVTGDAEFELKEDYTFGLFFRLSNRFAKTKIHRMPIRNEPFIFGGLVGEARVNPGVTLVVSPYVVAENLREGMGARIQYTYIHHVKDSWTDKRCDQSIRARVENIENVSSWTSSYITLNVFYDFGKVKSERSMQPIAQFNWDIPLSFGGAAGATKTHKVSLGLEWSF